MMQNVLFDGLESTTAGMLCPGDILIAPGGQAEASVAVRVTTPLAVGVGITSAVNSMVRNIASEAIRITVRLASNSL